LEAEALLDELRHRINIAELIGRKVRLTRRGRNHVGLCPFHTEKSPSFNVQEDRGFFHCFGCGAHGDAFTFVMETEGLNFREAVEKLAAEQGMDSPLKGGRSPKDEKGASGRTLYEVMDLAAAWFEEQLKAPHGAAARDYLKSRGLDGAARARFRLGFAPDGRTALIGHLSAKGVSLDEIIAAGLAGQAEGGGDPYDRFRARVMFPIFDVRGRCIAFGGRTLLPDGKPKYLNSPETPLFKKSAVLFNHQSARAAAAKGQQVVVAEGYVDVIALVMAGFEGAVAPLGTALTEDQIALLWRMADEPILCFDGDKAGAAAASRAIDRTLPELEPGKSLRFAILPQGQDPDDLIRAQGRDAMAWVLDGAKPLIEAIWERELQALDPSTPERVAGLRARLRALAGEIKDADLRRDYAQALNDRLKALIDSKRGGSTAGKSGPDALRAPRQGPSGRWPGPPDNTALGRLNRPGRASWTPRPNQSLKATAAARPSRAPHADISLLREEALVLSVINHPNLLERHLDLISQISLASHRLDKIRQELLHAASLGSPLDRRGIRDHLTARGLGDDISRMERKPLLKVMPCVQTQTDSMVVERDWLHAVHRHGKLTGLEAEYQLAAGALQDDLSEAAYRRLQEIDREIKLVLGMEAGPPDQP
jgi:DNA primase